MLQPANMLLLEVAHTPYVSALDQSQHVQATERLAVPVQIWQQKISLVFRGGVVWRAKQHMVLLSAAVENVKDPVQAALITLTLHEGTNVMAIYFWSLGDVTKGLSSVFLDMLVGARVDEIDLQVWRLCLAGGAVGHEPAVNVIVAEIVNV
jgi:hypothetical protein